MDFAIVDPEAMRLLNAHSIKLEEFGGEPGDGIPPYAILSHTWGRDEDSFREMAADHADLAQRKGFQKIVRCCEKARSEGHELYGSTRAASTNQAAPSYLKLLTQCFVGIEGPRYAMPTWMAFAPSRIRPRPHLHFEKVAGLLAGWTLQELLAPYEVVFLDGDWQEIGTKRSLSDIVSSQTKIAKQTLEDCTWGHVSIAAKMS